MTSLAPVAAISTIHSCIMRDRWSIPAASANTAVAINSGGGTGGMGPLQMDNYLSVGGSASVALNAIVGAQTIVCSYVPGVSIVADFVLGFLNNNSAWDFKIGFTTASGTVDGTPITEDACCVHLNHADYTKLRLYTNNNGGAGTQTTSTAAPVFGAGGVHCRLELHGASTPFGAVAYLFVNDTLAAQSSATLPRAASPGVALGFTIAGHCTTGTTANTMYLGPVKIMWNSSLAGAVI
jgi:hypothetical protein